MLDDVCCSSQLVLSLHLRFVSCNGFKFGNLGISLSGDIERVKRVFLSMSSYAAGVCPFSSGVDLGQVVG